MSQSSHFTDCPTSFPPPLPPEKQLDIVPPDPGRQINEDTRREVERTLVELPWVWRSGREPNKPGQT